MYNVLYTFLKSIYSDKTSSQTKVSQYMNNSPRAKGWHDFEEKVCKLLKAYPTEEETLELSSSLDESECDIEIQSPSRYSPLRISDVHSDIGSPLSNDNLFDEEPITRLETDPWQYFSLNQIFC